jgi:hypothetical protein
VDRVCIVNRLADKGPKYHKIHTVLLGFVGIYVMMVQMKLLVASISYSSVKKNS